MIRVFLCTKYYVSSFEVPIVFGEKGYLNYGIWGALVTIFGELESKRIAWVI